MTIVTWHIDNLGLSPGIPRSPYFFLESPRITFAHRLQLSSGKPALLVVGNQQERSQGQSANKIEVHELCCPLFRFFTSQDWIIWNGLLQISSSANT